MYFFDKKVEYLIWNMQEGQAKGVGTARFLAMDGVCRIEVTLTGCGRVQGTYPVYVLSGEFKSLLGEISMTNGKGELYIKCDTERLGDRRISYKQVTGIQIDLKTEGYLEQKWLPVIDKLQKTAVPKKFPQKEEKPLVQELPAVEQKQTEKQADDSLVAETNSVKKPPEKEGFQLYPSKWKQLCAIYPVVHPFGDGRAYLSIEPRDFVVLTERFQPMVENSFLLHSFYHYRHLLLGRHKQGRNVRYYLGVPGVFYEKEKAAALFYGFESFEGADHPTKEGSFGYYMKQVQI